MARKLAEETGNKIATRVARPAGAEVIDLETRLTRDHRQPLKLWLRMLSCTVQIENEIRSRLRGEFDITLPRFDLMAQLERHPEGLRMGELSRRMMVTGGSITGLADQLEREGLVVRVPDPGDRRVYLLRLTLAGRRAFLRMAEVHEEWVTNMLDGLSTAEKNSLMQLLARLKESLNLLSNQE